MRTGRAGRERARARERDQPLGMAHAYMYTHTHKHTCKVAKKTDLLARGNLGQKLMWNERNVASTFDHPHVAKLQYVATMHTHIQIHIFMPSPP